MKSRKINIPLFNSVREERGETLRPSLAKMLEFVNEFGEAEAIASLCDIFWILGGVSVRETDETGLYVRHRVEKLLREAMPYAQISTRKSERNLKKAVVR